MIFLLQLFWLSFCLIGMATLLALIRGWRLGRLQGFLADQSLPGLVFLTWSSALALLAPLIAVAYLVCLPLVLISGAYLCLLLTSMVYLWRRRNDLLLLWHKLDRSVTPLAMLAALSLAINYYFSLKTHGLLQSDAAVHIARVNLIAGSGHFSLADPYLGNHGVVDPRYSTNLVLGLMAVAAELLHSIALSIWYYSSAWMHLIIWLSLSFLIWNLVPKLLRRRWSYAILFTSPFLLGPFFIYPNFPDRLIIAWICLLIVGLKRLFERRRGDLVMAAVILIAATHSLYALMAAGFLVALVVLGLILKQIEPRTLKILAPAVLISLLPVSLNLYYPNRTNTSSSAFNAGTISGHDFYPVHYGRFLIDRISGVDLIGILALSACIASLLLAARLKSRHVTRSVLFGLAVVVALVDYTPAYLSLIAYYQLWKVSRNKTVKLMIVLLVVYYGLIAYNPLVIPLIYKQVPPWVIARFQEFNVIGLIAPVLAWLMLLDYPLQKWRSKRLSNFLYLIAVPTYLLVIPLVYAAINYRQVMPNLNMGANDRHTISMVQALQAFSPQLKGQVVFSDPETSFYTPSIVAGAHVVDTLDTNYSPMANINQRSRCAAVLINKLNYNDLRAAGVSRVITNGQSAFSRLAAHSSDLRHLGSYGTYDAYAVVSRPVSAKTSICAIAWGQ